MKKFKKLRILLVAASIIKSLFFLNCYAMEKNGGFAERHELLQEEDYSDEEEEDKKQKDVDSNKNVGIFRHGDVGLAEENKKLKKKILTLVNMCKKFKEKYNNANRIVSRLMKEDNRLLFNKFDDLERLVEIKKKELTILEDRIKTLKLFCEKNDLHKRNEELEKKNKNYKYLSTLYGVLREAFEIAIEKGRDLEGLFRDLERLLKEKERVIFDNEKEIDRLVNVVCNSNIEREEFKKENADLKEELKKEGFRNLYLKTLNHNITVENRVHRFEERLFGPLFSNLENLMDKFKRCEVDKVMLKNLLEENIKLKMENEIFQRIDVEKKINEIKLALKNKKPKLEFKNSNIEQMLEKINEKNNKG